MRLQMALLSWVLLSSLSTWPVENYAIIGDAGRTNNNSALVRSSINTLGVSKLIMPGDNLYSSTYEKVWQPWQDLNMQFSVVAIGNHNSGYSKEVNFFNMPAEYYKKSLGFADFLVLNSDNTQTVDEQMAWLENELKNSSSSLIFLVYHHPTYTISKVHTWTEKSAFQKAIIPILKKYRSKLTALLLGHDHLASVLHFGDLPVILSGAVQEVRNDDPVDYMSSGVQIKTEWYFDETPHWAKLTVYSNTAQVDFIKAQTNKIVCSVNLSSNSKATLQNNCN